MKFKFTWRIWVLIIVLILSIVAIFGNLGLFSSGVSVTSVVANSTAYNQGFRQGQTITQIDGNKISNVNDFTQAIQGKFTSGNNVRMDVITTGSEIIYFSNQTPNITVSSIPKSNIKMGLDFSGGARALVQAQNKSLTASDAKDLASIIQNRLNVFGLQDVTATPVSDLSGNYYIEIEIAGATPDDLNSLISQQGKFEAKIGNQTVFVGGNKDVTSVARSGQNAGITACQQNNGTGYSCTFQFSVYLSQSAANLQASITKNLIVNTTNSQGSFLNETLDLFVDDKQVDSLLISQGLQGIATTQISISGSGTGTTQPQAYTNAQNQMNRLQTILITGSLPYKLEIIKLDNISPILGSQFINSIFLAAIAGFICVFVIVFIRYRRFKASIALLVISISEIIIILGIAAIIQWNLDLPSMAGILATIGTGIDQQIILLDEARHVTTISIKEKLKRALAIILGAYFTGLASMIPLYWAAAGFFKGFAFTTIIGLTVGILITRPAFADLVRSMEE